MLEEDKDDAVLLEDDVGVDSGPTVVQDWIGATAKSAVKISFLHDEPRARASTRHLFTSGESDAR